MWYARSDEFLQQDFLETLRWVRTFGDVVFIVGAVAVAWQLVFVRMRLKGTRACPHRREPQCRAPERGPRYGRASVTVSCSHRVRGGQQPMRHGGSSRKTSAGPARPPE